MDRILISGGSGFLGSYLLQHFLELGNPVGLLKRTTSNTWRIDHVLNEIECFDIDKIEIGSIFDQFKPDLIIHTACDYGRSNGSLTALLSTNVIFASDLLENAIRCRTKAFINVGTLLPEEVNDYSLSKGQFEQWLKRYSENIQVINLKIEHMYGPKDDETKFFPWLINQLLNDVDSIDLTSGIQKRDFVYIDDVVSAFEVVISKLNALSSYEAFDVGTGDFIDVRSFVNMLVREIENKTKMSLRCKLNFGARSYRQNDIMVPVLDNLPLKTLGWEIKTDRQEGIRKMILDFI